jgi:phage N-6-adenine-methyltransferase
MNQERLFTVRQEQYTSDDYWTPKWIFDALGLEFDLDVASPPEGPMHTPCKAFYSQETDGLQQDWTGTVFMNPPFSNTTPWVRKWIQHGDGVALLPCVKETKWVRELFDSNATVVWLNDCKIEFHHKGKSQHIWTIVWLWAIGDKCSMALKSSGMGRVR